MWPALVSQLGRQMASRELCSASLVASSSRVLLPPRQITLRALSTSAVRQKKKGSTSGSKNVKKHQEHADIAGDKEDASSGSKVDLPPILEKLEVKMKAATDAAQRFAYDQVERGQGRIHPSALDSVKVELGEEHGGRMLLKSLASITVRGTNLMVEAFDPETTGRVFKGIVAAKLPGIDPLRQTDNLIKIPISQPTTAQRDELIRTVSDNVNKAKEGVRKARNEGMNALGGRNMSGSDEVDELAKRYGTDLDSLLKKVRDTLSK